MHDHTQSHDVEAELRVRLAALTLEQKVSLLTGQTTWNTYALPDAGLDAMSFSDGPVGVRGITGDPADWSVLLPAPSAVAATWDTDAAYRVGETFAAEALRKDVHLVLAPVVNLQRTPVSGRHFEYQSEDPLLTGDLGSALTRGAQAHGVGVSLKHFVANDSETDRTTYRADVDERTMRECYLAPFEQIVAEANPWSVMAAYNVVDALGTCAPATEHRPLLLGVLKGEWEYDGVVVSDWLAASTTVETATGGLDLVMPGPGGPWEAQLLEAVRDGRVPESDIDDKVLRILRLAGRTGALAGVESSTSDVAAHTRDELAALAARATVVLRNDDVGGAPLLPLAPSAVTRIALIGSGAVDPFLQGGGSGVVHPREVSLPLGAITARFPGAEVSLHRGGDIARQAPDLDVTTLSTCPTTGAPGLSLTYVDAAGTVLHTDVLAGEWDGRPDLPAGAESATDLVIRGTIRLTAPGTHVLEAATVGEHDVHLAGRVLSTGTERVGAECILNSTVNDPQGPFFPVEVGEEPVDVELSATVQVIDGEGYGKFTRLALRHRGPGENVEGEIAEAVAAAAAADVAVVIVGTSLEHESEGWDRDSLDLPAHQDELVRRVAAANPRTIVVVNAGGPVLLPWLDEADGPAATVWWWLPGQEAGASLAAVLAGDIEPSGRLPWTLPARAADVPVPHAIPVDGTVTYSEGTAVGYRSWEQRDAAPARPFGFGLGWGSWVYADAIATRDTDGAAVLSLDVTNTSTRQSREVVQVYADVDGTQGTERRLMGYRGVSVAPGATVRVDVQVSPWAARTWDPASGTWQPLPAGTALHAGRHVRDLRSTTTLPAPAAQG